MVEFVFDGEEKIVGMENMKDLAEMMVIAAESEEKPYEKKENACYQHFLLFPQRFSDVH